MSILWIIGIYGGIYLIGWIISKISNAIEKRREAERDKATQDFLQNQKITPEQLVAEYKEKILKTFGKAGIQWADDPDWFNNVHFQKQFLGGLYKKHQYQELEGKCPNCDKGFLRVRKGQYGKFVGCSNFPQCKYTIDFSKAKEQYKTNINLDFLKALGRAYR